MSESNSSIASLQMDTNDMDFFIYVLITRFLPCGNHVVEIKGAAWSTGALKEELWFLCYNNDKCYSVSF